MKGTKSAGRVAKSKKTVAAKAKPSKGKGAAPVGRETSPKAVPVPPKKPDLTVAEGGKKGVEQIPAEQVTGKLKDHVASQGTIKNLRDQLAEGIKVEDDMLTALQDKIRENIRLELIIDVEEARSKNGK